MIRYKAAVLVLGAGGLCSLRAAALGIGEITLNSYLNEPLRASVLLLETAGIDERQLRIRLASRDDFDRVGADRAYFLTSLSFEVELFDDGRGRVLITSNEPVLEPYLNFLIEARWPDGRLLREFTVLLDPPTYAPATAVVGASARQVQADREAAERVATAPPPPVEEVEVRSGDTVRTRVDGDGREAPQRPFTAGTAPTPSGGDRYLVRSGETLWAIASRIQPDERLLQQTMLDIQRRNPEAFINGNINQIKAGYIVYLPRADEIGSAPSAEAVAAVREQNEAWRTGREAEPSPAPSLRVTSPEAEAAAPAADAAGPASVAPPASPAAAPALDTELAARLSAIESQMDNLQRLVELKDQQIAALQESLAARDAALAAAQAAAASAPLPSRVEPVGTTRSPAWLTALADNLLYLGALLLALVLAAAGVFVRRRNSQAQSREAGRRRADGRFEGVKLVDAGLVVGRNNNQSTTAAAAATAAVAARPVAATVPADEAFNPAMSSTDALAEADIYIAYGRYPQARDLLRKAIANDPLNAAFRLKLLEVCAETLDQREFQQQYADLLVLGDNDTVQQAERIVDSFADGEAWRENLPPTALTAGQLEAVAERSARRDLAQDDAPWAAELADGSIASEIGETDVNPFLSDIDEPQSAADEAAAMAALDQFANTGDPDTLDTIDLDLPDLDELTRVDDEPTGSRPDPAVAKQTNTEGPLELDLTADLGEPLQNQFQELSIDTEQADFDLDLSLDPLDDSFLLGETATGSTPAVLGTDTTQADPGRELGSEPILQPDQRAAPGDPTGAAATVPPLTTDRLLAADDQEPIFAVGGDEAAAKMDLARAFIDIGEHDGARQLLEEVLQDGSEAQREEAAALMEQLA